MLSSSEVFNQVGRLYEQLTHSIEDKLQQQKQLRGASSLAETDHRHRLNNNRELLVLSEVRDMLARIVDGHSKECHLPSDFHSHEEPNEYQFLRAVWTSHRASQDMPIDDRLDRLNKIVAMMRGNLSNKFADCKVAFRSRLNDPEQCATTMQELVEQPMYAKLKEKMEAALMKNEELTQRLADQQAKHSKLEQQYDQLLFDAKKVKDKMRSLEIRYLESCKRQQQANDKLLRVNNELLKCRHRSVFKGSGFTLELFQLNSKTTNEPFQEEVRVSVELAEVKQFLESFKEAAPAGLKATQLLQASLSHPPIPRLLLRGEKENLQAACKSQRSENSKLQISQNVREVMSPRKERSRSRSRLLTTHFGNSTDRQGEGALKFTRKINSQNEGGSELRESKQLNTPLPASSTTTSKIFDERSFFTRQLSKPVGSSAALLAGQRK